MGMPNLVLLPAHAIVAERRITAQPILIVEEKKVISPKMRLNGSSAKLVLDPATAKGKGKEKAKAKAKARLEETVTGRGKATAGSHLALTGRKGTVTASGRTIVVFLMMDLREEKERHQHHWQLRYCKEAEETNDEYAGSSTGRC
jgi:hypothetical protein